MEGERIASMHRICQSQFLETYSFTTGRPPLLLGLNETKIKGKMARIMSLLRSAKRSREPC